MAAKTPQDPPPYDPNRPISPAPPPKRLPLGGSTYGMPWGPATGAIDLGIWDDSGKFHPSSALKSIIEASGYMRLLPLEADRSPFRSMADAAVHSSQEKAARGCEHPAWQNSFHRMFGARCLKCGKVGVITRNVAGFLQFMDEDELLTEWNRPGGPGSAGPAQASPSADSGDASQTKNS